MFEPGNWPLQGWYMAHAELLAGLPCAGCALDKVSRVMAWHLELARDAPGPH